MADPARRVAGTERAALGVAGRRSLQERTTRQEGGPSDGPLEGAQSEPDSRLRAGADA